MTAPAPDTLRTGEAPRRDRRFDVLAAIGLGGGLGSVARHLVSRALPIRPGHFPWDTFLVNVSGCFALGALTVFALEVWPARRYVRPFAGVGVLGGFTTFSTFAVEIHGLAARGRWALADAYALDSLAGGLAAAWFGIALARLAGARRARKR